MNGDFNIDRYPPSSDKSLKAFSAADEYIVKMTSEALLPSSKIAIINDRFGYLSLHLRNNKSTVLTHYKSQENAIRKNFELNELDANSIQFRQLIRNEDSQEDIILIKVPKTMDLFHLFLLKAHSNSDEATKVFCGFMTRHFTGQMLKLASYYFEQIEQSRAWKKSRVLMLSTPKSQVETVMPIHNIPFINHRSKSLLFKQYFGVFSANHIDYATQFLLKHLHINPHIKKALDLASGNGVIAYEIRAQNPNVEIHLLDDSYLAVESSKLNLKEGINHFHCHYNLDQFEDQYFDLVVCNPPFHFEHENTIDIALQLFAGVLRTMKVDGSFILVSNLHLNYKTHLSKIFRSVEILHMNSKFEIIQCKK